MKYRILAEPLAVCQLASDSRIPDWALEGGFFCVVRTSAELSIVCLEKVCSEKVCTADHLLNGARVERGWIALKLEGPFPFSMTGVLASFVQPLADVRISVFAISTFDTDYVLIKRDKLEEAVSALAVSGHEKIE